MKEEISIQKKIRLGLIWQGAERFATQCVSFIVSIILARILAPSEFGTLAVVLVVINLCDAFIDCGFSQALIQKKNADDIDYSCIFYFNLLIALLLYIIIFFLSPIIAKFYNKIDIVIYLRVLSIVFVIRSFSIIQLTILNKLMLFKYNFIVNSISIILSGIVGVISAYNKLGVWALILQQVSKALIAGVSLWLLVKWKPLLVFSLSRIKRLFNFSGKMFLAGLIDTLYKDIYNIIIGKMFSFETLAYYNRGEHLPRLGMHTINSVYSTVLFPAFSQVQDDKRLLKELARKNLIDIMFIVFPIMAGFIILAKHFVILLLGEKWLPCVPYLQLCCIIYVFWPLYTINLKIITASGRSDIFLVIEIIKKVQALVMILITYRFGAFVMVLGSVFLAPISFIENAWPNKRIIMYSVVNQVGDLLPNLFITIISALIIYFIFITKVSSLYIAFFGGGILFLITYTFICFITHVIPEDYIFLFNRFFKKE